MIDKTTNSFIHGTNSTLLTLLPHTDFSLFSPVWMIENYQYAPIHGEISGGGLDSSSSESRLAFSNLKPPYELKNLVAKYAIKTPLYTKEQLISQAKEEIEWAPKVLFSNINQILIHVMRIKQYGIANHEWLSAEEQQTLNNKIASQVQLSYLLLLLGSKIHFDQKIRESISNDEQHKQYIDTLDAVESFLTPELLLDRISQNPNIDIKAIYENENPSDSELLSVIALLDLEKNCDVTTGSWQKRRVNLIETRVFTLEEPKKKYSFDDSPTKPAYVAAKLLRNEHSGFFSEFMGILHRPKEEFFKRFHACVLEEVQAMEHRLSLLQKILDKQPVNILDMDGGEFIKDSFPILLVCESEEKLKSIDREYRAQEPLKLGVDIKIIVTDSAVHQQLINDYLVKYNLDHLVKVDIDPIFNQEAVKKNSQQEIEDIFAEIMKENSCLRSLLSKNNKPDTLLGDYKKALLDELKYLPIACDHPLRAARALAALNDPAQKENFLSNLDNFNKQAMDAKFYAQTRIIASKLIIALALAAVSCAAFALCHALPSVILLPAILLPVIMCPVLLLAGFVGYKMINELSDMCTDYLQLNACKTVYKSKTIAKSLGLLFQPSLDSDVEKNPEPENVLTI